MIDPSVLPHNDAQIDKLIASYNTHLTEGSEEYALEVLNTALTIAPQVYTATVAAMASGASRNSRPAARGWTSTRHCGCPRRRVTSAWCASTASVATARPAATWRSARASPRTGA